MARGGSLVVFGNEPCREALQSETRPAPKSDNASIPVEFRFEIDASGDPFRYEAAGTLRG